MIMFINLSNEVNLKKKNISSPEKLLSLVYMHFIER